MIAQRNRAAHTVDVKIGRGEVLDWKEKAVDLKLSGVTWTQMAGELQKATGLTLEYNHIRSAVRRHPRYKEINGQVIDIKSATLKELEKDSTSDQLCKKLNITPRILTATVEDLKEEGYLVEEVNGCIRLCKHLVAGENLYELAWSGEKIFRFGVVSDNHLCSKWQQLTHLNTLYDIFYEEGIRTVYNPGDITEGVNMRPGHEFEVFKHGADDQVRYVIDNYPSRPGITTEFITGNHDHSSVKRAGYDIGKSIAKERPDMKYLGMANAKIKLTHNCSVELNHALDGAAYALSYALQKRIDSMTGGEKPNILLDGHHHKAIYLPYRNIHAFECGTTQAQTPWMRGKRLAAMVGGWIIKLHVDDEGTVTRCKGEFIQFYKMIEKDY